MSRYERVYGTDWEELDEDEAIDRAYALGVAASLGEYHREELEAIRDEMTTAYNRSVVDLAFDEGKNEGREVESEESETVWNELVIGEEVTIDPDELPTGGRNGLPEAVDRMDALDLPDRDSTDALDLPEFLDRE
ncbi:MAG: hypothetical protein V5A52_02190 [Halovenus sp.]|uniref:hypothetical protein n=1 Tax=Halovenus amylolytica TaxID=2500550 RepID=UPI000FE439E8